MEFMFIFIMLLFTIVIISRIVAVIKSVDRTKTSDKIAVGIMSVLLLVIFGVLWSIIPVRTERVVLNKNSKMIYTETKTLKAFSVSGTDTLLAKSISTVDTINVSQKPDSLYLEKETMYTIFGAIFSKQIKK